MIYLDASGNPVTEQVQSVGVTDPSGNPVTGTKRIKNLQTNFIQKFEDYICFIVLIEIPFLDPSGNPVTEKVTVTTTTTLPPVTVGVTDASGNPVTG